VELENPGKEFGVLPQHLPVELYTDNCNDNLGFTKGGWRKMVSKCEHLQLFLT